MGSWAYPSTAVTVENTASSSFWKGYHALPKRIRQQADQQFLLFRRDPSHPSLHFKPIKAREGLWSVSVTPEYRAIAIRLPDSYLWIFIGTHTEYDALLKGKS